MKSLCALTKPEEPFEWTELCEAVFQKLKWEMTPTPVLAFPNNVDPFILDTYASDVEIGTALHQVHNGTVRHVSFASSTFTSVTVVYHTQSCWL